MRSIYKPLLVTACCFAIVLSCSKTNNDKPAQAKAGIKVLLTDEPAAYSAINVNLVALEYNTSPDTTITTGWQPLALSNPGIVNLLSLQNGTTSTLTNVQVDPVDIRLLRLKIGPTGNTVVDDGITYPLIVPDEVLQKGAIVAASYKLESNQSLTICIDFNARASVLHTPSTTVYTLWPRLRTFDVDNTGSVEGNLLPTAARTELTLRSGPPGVNTPPAVITVARGDTTNNGYFKIIGLPPGSYHAVVYSSNGANYAAKTIENITITKNQTTNIGTVTLGFKRVDVVSLFTGNWKVVEAVAAVGSEFKAADTFMAKTIVLNDSTFATVQTARTPDPDWVLSWPYANADTLGFVPLTSGRALKSIFGQGNIGTYSENRDTLQFTYGFGSPNFAHAYLVTQKWVRQQ